MSGWQPLAIGWQVVIAFAPLIWEIIAMHNCPRLSGWSGRTHETTPRTDQAALQHAGGSQARHGPSSRLSGSGGLAPSRVTRTTRSENLLHRQSRSSLLVRPGRSNLASDAPDGGSFPGPVPRSLQAFRPAHTRKFAPRSCISIRDGTQRRPCTSPVSG